VLLNGTEDDVRNVNGISRKIAAEGYGVKDAFDGMSEEICSVNTAPTEFCTTADVDVDRVIPGTTTTRGCDVTDAVISLRDVVCPVKTAPSEYCTTADVGVEVMSNSRPANTAIVCTVADVHRDVHGNVCQVKTALNEFCTTANRGANEVSVEVCPVKTALNEFCTTADVEVEEMRDVRSTNTAIVCTVVDVHRGECGECGEVCRVNTAQFHTTADRGNSLVNGAIDVVCSVKTAPSEFCTTADVVAKVDSNIVRTNTARACTVADVNCGMSGEVCKVDTAKSCKTADETSEDDELWETGDEVEIVDCGVNVPTVCRAKCSIVAAVQSEDDSSELSIEVFRKEQESDSDIGPILLLKTDDKSRPTWDDMAPQSPTTKTLWQQSATVYCTGVSTQSTKSRVYGRW